MLMVVVTKAAKMMSVVIVVMIAMMIATIMKTRANISVESSGYQIRTIRESADHHACSRPSSR